MITSDGTITDSPTPTAPEPKDRILPERCSCGAPWRFKESLPGPYRGPNGVVKGWDPGRRISLPAPCVRWAEWIDRTRMVHWCGFDMVERDPLIDEWQRFVDGYPLIAVRLGKLLKLPPEGDGTIPDALFQPGPIRVSMSVFRLRAPIKELLLTHVSGDLGRIGKIQDAGSQADFPEGFGPGLSASAFAVASGHGLVQSVWRIPGEQRVNRISIATRLTPNGADTFAWSNHDTDCGEAI